MASGDPEDIIESTVVNKAEKAGWFVRKVKWGEQGRRSAPDRVFIKDGRTVWIEFKDLDCAPDILQAREHRRMRAAGAELHVVDTVRDGLRILGIA